MDQRTNVVGLVPRKEGQSDGLQDNPEDDEVIYGQVRTRPLRYLSRAEAQKSSGERENLLPLHSPFRFDFLSGHSLTHSVTSQPLDQRVSQAQVDRPFTYSLTHSRTSRSPPTPTCSVVRFALEIYEPKSISFVVFFSVVLVAAFFL